jgi:protein phosphatase methylesterase 1
LIVDLPESLLYIKVFRYDLGTAEAILHQSNLFPCVFLSFLSASFCRVVGMSDLQKSFAKSHLSRLPPEPPPIYDERDGEDDLALSNESLDDASSSASSTGTIVPSPGKKLFGVSKDSSRSLLGPLPWTDFFAQELYFDRWIDDAYSITHHAYLSPPTDSGPLFVTHHGAGSSGLSFATFTAEIQKLLPKAGVLSLDARGHGRTTISDPSSPTPENPLDLTLDTLSSDLALVVQETAHRMSWPQLPDIILIGHSLGGAVITDVAYKRLLGPSLLGYGVLDVVEGP